MLMGYCDMGGAGQSPGVLILEMPGGINPITAAASPGRRPAKVRCGLGKV